MAISVNTKPGFMFGANASSKNQNFYEKTVERLSSGKRITSAADNAAGLATLSKLEAAVSVNNKVIRNAADGQSLLQSADSSAAEISNILNRMKELAVQAANGTTSIAQREALQSEANQLTAQISRIADSTSFNGRTPLSGEEIDLQVGSSSEEQINISLKAVNSRDLQLDARRVSFDTSSEAHDAISTIDAAIEKVNSVKGDIGASMNRISSAIENLSNTGKNTRVVTGQISDADIADETTRRAKSQLLQQSALAISAQGNTSKEVMLRLIS
jgi:flagellin